LGEEKVAEELVSHGVVLVPEPLPEKGCGLSSPALAGVDPGQTEVGLCMGWIDLDGASDKTKNPGGHSDPPGFSTRISHYHSTRMVFRTP
jgi:hypothetical protein